jgi:hypothetical protein
MRLLRVEQCPGREPSTGRVHTMGGYVKSVSLAVFMRCWRDFGTIRRILSGDVALMAT